MPGTARSPCARRAVSRHKAVLPYEGAKPQLGEEVFVAPTASVIGNVKLGHRSSVWYSAILRGERRSTTPGPWKLLALCAAQHDARDPPSMWNVVPCPSIGGCRTKYAQVSLLAFLLQETSTPSRWVRTRTCRTGSWCTSQRRRWETPHPLPLATTSQSVRNPSSFAGNSVCTYGVGAFSSRSCAGQKGSYLRCCAVGRARCIATRVHGRGRQLDRHGRDALRRLEGAHGLPEPNFCLDDGATPSRLLLPSL